MSCCMLLFHINAQRLETFFILHSDRAACKVALLCNRGLHHRTVLRGVTTPVTESVHANVATLHPGL